MWHRFGQGFGGVVLRGAAEAETDGAWDLSTRHLLRALVAEGGTPAAQEALDRSDARECPADGLVPSLTPAAHAAVERADMLAAEWNDVYIGGEHLLLALVREPGASDAGRALARSGVDWEWAGRALMAQQSWRTRPPEGVRVPGLGTRRPTGQVHAAAGRLKRLAGGLAHHGEPFLRLVGPPMRPTVNFTFRDILALSVRWH